MRCLNYIEYSNSNYNGASIFQENNVQPSKRLEAIFNKIIDWLPNNVEPDISTDIEL